MKLQKKIMWTSLMILLSAGLGIVIAQPVEVTTPAPEQALSENAVPSPAENDHLVTLDTRPGVSVQIYYMKRVGATATVGLLPGGAGDLGMKNGLPGSKNFLVRSRDYFASNGFNVAVIGKPSDKYELGFGTRVSSEHLEDLFLIVKYLNKDSGLPVWLIGTSKGTISATAAAISFGKKELAGIVLTSSVTSVTKEGAVPGQNLGAIDIPVLVVHHELDECKICVPGDASLITKRLTHALIKKEIYVNGGANLQGDPCEALHWHGYIGMEKKVVDLISDWIMNPVP
jgi:hypothetical protein